MIGNRTCVCNFKITDLSLGMSAAYDVIYHAGPVWPLTRIFLSTYHTTVHNLQPSSFSEIYQPSAEIVKTSICICLIILFVSLSMKSFRKSKPLIWRMWDSNPVCYMLLQLSPSAGLLAVLRTGPFETVTSRIFSMLQHNLSNWFNYMFVVDIWRHNLFREFNFRAQNHPFTRCRKWQEGRNQDNLLMS